MKAFSRSQGKIVDVPDTIVGGQSEDIFQQTTGGMGDTGSRSTNQSQQAFQQAALMDLLTTGGKNFSKIQAMQSFFPNQADTKKLAVPLRQEFSAETKNLGFETLRNAWNSVKDPNAKDLTIVYAYIKTLDPTSVVREGEIDLTKAQESVGSNIVRMYKRAKEGGTMSPKVRNEMLGEIARIYNDRAKKQQELNAFYSGLAVDSGVEPNDVIGKLGNIEFAQVPENKATTKENKIGGTLGGILGGVGGMMAGGPVGAGLGAAAGYGAGGAVQQSIEDLTGRQREQPMEQLKSVGGGALGAGLTGYSAGSLLKLLGGVAKAGIGGSVVKAGEKARSLSPKSILGERQRAAAETLGNKKIIDTNKIYQAGKKYLESDPAAARVLKQNQSAIKSAQTAPNLLDRLEVWGKAYTNASKVGKSSEAGLFDKLYKMGLQELRTKAPEVAKNRSLLRMTYEAPKAIGKGLWNVVKGRAALGGL